MKRKQKISFLINPTIYQDFDIIAVGRMSDLRRLKNKCEGSHLIKKSNLGFPIVLLETFDDAYQAVKRIEELRTVSL